MSNLFKPKKIKIAAPAAEKIIPMPDYADKLSKSRRRRRTARKYQVAGGRESTILSDTLG